MIIPARLECVRQCSRTDDCLAVNVIGNRDITCELTTGLSSENEMEDAHNSELLVLGMKYIFSFFFSCFMETISIINLVNNCVDYNKCTEEPGFCLNGATCEQTLITTRCHCTNHYQGDRCDTCPERFQGDECDQCVERFQGDSCQECISRFEGDYCQECADNHYGDDCGMIFFYIKIQWKSPFKASL